MKVNEMGKLPIPDTAPAHMAENERPEPEMCPYCGSLISSVPIADNDGEIVVWASGQCANPECQTKAMQEYERNRATYDMEMIRQQQHDYDVLVLDNYLHRYGLGQEYENAALNRITRDNKSMLDAYQYAVTYVSQFTVHQTSSKGMYVCGPAGSGKTYLVASIANALLTAGVIGILPIRECDLLGNLRAAYDGLVPEWKVMDVYRKASLLIIDDVGLETDTPGSAKQLFRILTARYEDKRPTVITSPYRLEELTELYCRICDRQTIDTLMSRIGSRYDIVKVVGRDRRVQTPQATTERKKLAFR